MVGKLLTKSLIFLVIGAAMISACTSRLQNGKHNSAAPSRIVNSEIALNLTLKAGQNKSQIPPDLELTVMNRGPKTNSIPGSTRSFFGDVIIRCEDDAFVLRTKQEWTNLLSAFLGPPSQTNLAPGQSISFWLNLSEDYTTLDGYLFTKGVTEFMNSRQALWKEAIKDRNYEIYCILHGRNSASNVLLFKGSKSE
jgi:hypothetical protein